MNCIEERIDEAWLLLAKKFIVLVALRGMQNSQKRIVPLLLQPRGADGLNREAEGWKNSLILPALWVCQSLTDSPRRSLWLYCKSRVILLWCLCYTSKLLCKCSWCYWLVFDSESASAFWQWCSQWLECKGLSPAAGSWMPCVRQPSFLTG